MNKITLLLVFTFLSVLTYGQTYYVGAKTPDTNQPKGSEANPFPSLDGAIKYDEDNPVASPDLKLTIYIDGEVSHSTDSKEIIPHRNMYIIGKNNGVLQGSGSVEKLNHSIFKISALDKDNLLEDIVLKLKDLTVEDMYNEDSAGTVINLNTRKAKGISIELENCIFKNNVAIEKPGSVVSITGPTDNAYSLKIKKCYFEGAGPNYVSSNGGSIYISNPTTDVFIENSTFRKFYTSDKGGAICIDKAKSFKGVNLTVAGNECASDNDDVNSAGIQIISVNGANLLQNSIVVGNSMPEASKNTNLISGSSINTQNCLIDNYDSVGQLSIKGFAFDATKNVYKYENGSMPVKTGDASFLSEDLDQIGNVRKKSEVMAVDIGAWHSNHSTKGGGVLSIGALEVSNTSIKVYQDNAGNVVVEAPETNEVTATVYSIVGSKILEVQIVNEIGVIKTDVLNSGVYVLELNADGNKIAKQFIIE